MQITCEDLGGHPLAQFRWKMPQDAEVDISAQPQTKAPIFTTFNKHTDTRHTIKYKANLNDNNGEIRCIATQTDRDGTVLYENTARLKLKVSKVLPPKMMTDGNARQPVNYSSPFFYKSFKSWPCPGKLFLMKKKF